MVHGYTHTGTPRLRQWMLALMACIALASCSPQMPTLSLSIEQGADSLALCLYVEQGQVQRTDTIALEGGTTLKLEPDTSQYRELYIDYGKGLRYFALSNGVWTEQTPTTAESQRPEHVPAYSIVDTEGKYHYITNKPEGAKRLIMTFVSLPLEMPTKGRMDSIDSLYRTEKTAHIYLLLSPSDSLCRRLGREAKLGGIICSDSLGQVSELRQLLGIERRAGTIHLSVDSTNRLSPLP